MIYEAIRISYDNVLNMYFQGILSRRIVYNGFEKLLNLSKILDDISLKSGVTYPPVIVLPEARILEHEEGVSAILYANIGYRRGGGYLYPVVETYLPFILYGDTRLYKMVFSHELLHYIYLAIKYVREEHISSVDIYTSSISGRIFLDEVYRVRPETIFEDRFYIRLLNMSEKLLSRSRVAYSIRRNWIDRGRPTNRYKSRDFRLKVSIEELSRLYFPDEVIERVRHIMDRIYEGL